MKITKVETIQLPEHPHLIWIRIHTDEDGIYGIGETAPRTGSVRRIIHDILAGMLIGKDPRNIEGLWHDMFQAVHYHGYAGSEMRAVSAVDMALWDILGKYTNQPIYRLLGGKVRDRIPVYNTCISHGQYNDNELFMSSPGKLAESLLKEGITGMKIWPFDMISLNTRGHGISSSDLKKGVAIIKEIRDAVGDEMEIALEGHANWDLPSAIKIAKALEEYNLMWLEDMIPADNVKTMLKLKESTSTPLAVSERLFTRHQFLPYIENQAADFVMPDVAWIGGISELKKVATIASTYQLPIAPHNCWGPIQTHVYAHTLSNIENVYKIETVRSFYHTYYKKLVNNPPMIHNGYLYVSDDPGLGVDLHPDLFKRNDMIVESSENLIETVAWTAGDPWKDDLGKKF